MAQAPWTRVFTIVTCLCLSGCSSQPDLAQISPQEKPQSGGALRLALEPPTQIDPALTDDAYEATIGDQVFSGLVQWDDDLNILPELAHSWTISQDGLTYEFKLRSNALFHHGRNVTAQDFVYTFTRLFDSNKVPLGIIQDYLIAVEGVEDFVDGRAQSISGLQAIDDLTLRITLSRPYPSFMHVLCMDQAKVVPPEVLEQVGKEAFGRNPVGTGPFKMSSWDEEQLVLVRNENYFSRPAYLDSLVFVHYPDSLATNIKTDFIDGRLDGRGLRAAEESELRRHGNYFVVKRPELSLEILGFNVSKPPLNDVRVRRAISMSIDRNAYQEISGSGFYKPAGLLPPGMPGYTPESKIWDESIEEAKALLAQAGYDESNPLQFDIFTASFSEYARQRDSVMVSSLARSNIIPTVNRVSWQELERRINDLDADSFFIIWVADFPDPDTFLYTLFAGHGQYNMFGYQNSVVDSLLEAGRGELTVAKRLELNRAAEKIILEEAPCAPLFNFMVSYAFHPYVRGVEMSPFGLNGIPMHKIWIDHPTMEKVHASF